MIGMQVEKYTITRTSILLYYMFRKILWWSCQSRKIKNVSECYAPRVSR